MEAQERTGEMERKTTRKNEEREGRRAGEGIKKKIPYAEENK